VNDQLLFGEKLQRAVTFHVNGVPKAAVGGRKHGNPHGRRVPGRPCRQLQTSPSKTPSGIIDAIIPAKWLTILKHTPRWNRVVNITARIEPTKQRYFPMFPLAFVR
jgi:hypothetical protein